MKKAIYFPLNTTHYSSVKSLNIRMKFDFAGYAIYVMTLQKLAEASNRTLPLTDVPALAFDFRCDKTLLQSIIENGFEIDGQNFFSTELNDSLAWFDAKHNASSEGGKKAAAGMSPEELSERGKKAIKTRWEKAQAKKNEELKKEIEEQLQAESFEEQTNESLSECIRLPESILDVNNDLFRGNTNELESEYKEVSIGLEFDTNNINRNVNVNGEKIEMEKKENVNNNKNEIETRPSGLNLNKPNLVSSLMKVYELTPEVISIYLGVTNNKKLFNLYLQQSSDLKSKLTTYYQFEKAYLIALGNILHERTTQNVLSRELFIEELNTNFENISIEVLSKITTAIIDMVKSKEDVCNKQLLFLRCY